MVEQPRSEASQRRHDAQTPTEQLDDVEDRDELRGRFEMLLQELRVCLPGVQVLSAFLLTAPFSQQFDRLDDWGRRAYAVALIASMLSVVLLLGPTLLHRVGPRTARSQRLQWSVRLLLGGLLGLGVALVAALWGIVRFVFGTTLAWAVTVPMTLVVASVWLIVPAVLRVGHDERRRGR